MTDSVVSPSHYVSDAPTLEPMELTMRLPHPLASAFEYVYRAGKKPGVPAEVDLRKAAFWLKSAAARIDAGLVFPRPSDTIYPLLIVFAQKSKFAEVILREMLQKYRLDSVQPWESEDLEEFWKDVFQAASAYVETLLDKLEAKQKETSR